MLGLVLCVPGLAQGTASVEPTEVQTVVIPVHGVVGVTTAAIVRRGYSEARARSAARVLLDIDTPGGLESEMREVESVLAQIRAEGMHTAAFVRKEALSAGAYLALACHDLFMAPDATIGAITPVLLDASGRIMEIPDDDARSKVYAAMRADVRALVEARRNVRGDVVRAAEAMVDPTLRLFEVAYEDRSGMTVQELMFLHRVRELEAEGLKIISRHEFGSRPLVLTTEEAIDLGLAKGRAASLENLVRDEYLTTMSTTLVLDETWSENAVRWLDALKPVLFVLGLLLLLVEVKTPGFFVPGVLGIALLGLAMFSSYLVGLADVTEILLLFLGLAALAVEIFFLPGTIVFGAIGFVSVVAAMILSQQTFVVPGSDTEREILTTNLTNLLLVTLGVVVAFGGYVKLLPRIPFLNRVLLTPPPAHSAGTAQGTTTSPVRGAALAGQMAVSATDLRPAGIVELPDGARYDAMTRGEFVAAGTPVRILHQAYQQLVVEAATDASTPSSSERGQVAIGVLLLLVLAGFALIVAEVFFPSLGVLGGMAALSLLSAIVLAFTSYGPGTGFVFLLLAAIGAPIAAMLALRALPRTRLGRQLILSEPTRDEITTATPKGLETLVRASGVAETVLRPAGIARIDGRRVDVVTRGELIEAGTPVTVLMVEGGRVVVGTARVPTPAPEAP